MCNYSRKWRRLWQSSRRPERWEASFISLSACVLAATTVSLSLSLCVYVCLFSVCPAWCCDSEVTRLFNRLKKCTLFKIAALWMCLSVLRLKKKHKQSFTEMRDVWTWHQNPLWPMIHLIVLFHQQLEATTESWLRKNIHIGIILWRF